jgi:hypothetical protein
VNWSLGLTVETLHVVTASAVVGGQLLLSAAAWRRSPADGGTAGALAPLERFYRLFALAAVLAAAGFGAWLLRYTLVSTLLLVSTPYGPVLAAKVLGTLAFLLYLLVAPPLLAQGGEDRTSGPGAFTRRAWALVGAVLVVALTALSTSLRYL